MSEVVVGKEVTLPEIIEKKPSEAELTEEQKYSLTGYLEQRKKLMTADDYKLTLRNKCGQFYVRPKSPVLPDSPYTKFLKKEKSLPKPIVVSEEEIMERL